MPPSATALADPRLPKRITLAVGIERMDHAGLLSDHQHTLSVMQIHQDRRLSKIVIRTMVFRTVGRVGAEAGYNVAVLGGGLAMPKQPAARKVERDDGIAGLCRRV